MADQQHGRDAALNVSMGGGAPRQPRTRFPAAVNIVAAAAKVIANL